MYIIQNEQINENVSAELSGLVIVMIQGDYCGYCTQMKPIFQQLADELSPHTGLKFATIQIDGNRPSEQIFQIPDSETSASPLTHILGKPLEGVPMVLKFFQGKPVDEFKGNRDIESLKNWILS